MKRFSFFFVLALLVVSFGLVNAQETITITNMTGTWDDGGTTRIVPAAPVTITLGIDNSYAGNVKQGGFGMGFQLWSSDGTMAPTVFDTLPLAGDSWGDMFTLSIAVQNHNVDGAGRDTVGLLTAGFPSDPGLAAGRVITDAALITTGGVAEGETLCIDSSFVPTSTFWKWGSGFIPEWSGPFCWTAVTPPCLPPILDNGPASFSGSHCNLIEFDFDGHLDPTDGSGATSFTYSSDIGTMNPNTGEWSYPPTLANVGASISVTVTLDNGVCAQDYVIPINVTNEAPQISCPVSLSVSAGVATNVQLTATDDCDPFTFNVISGPATVDGTGLLTVLADPAGMYTVVVEATDGNASTQCTIEVEAIAGSLYQVEIPCVGDQEENFVYQGQFVDVPVMFSGPVIGGFDFLVAYDNSALSFQYAEAGAALTACGWEYFTYRYGADGNCSNACPSGLLRMVGIAETNNGPNHPVDMCDVDGELAVMTFLVTNDRTFECTSIPIRFFWLDCGDNTLSNWDGDSLIISEFIYDGDEVLFPPFGDEIQNFDYGYPTYFGAQNSDCDTEEPKAAYRLASFNNGCVFVACADSIDDRGDLNLNNVPNEIADAVLYSNYFVYGIGVLDINTEGQIAASDVNADGLTLSVADLVYLIRIIIGDALPYAKLSPVAATISDDNGKLNVNAEMGAAFVVYEGNVTPTLLAENMTLVYAYDANTNSTRTLVWSEAGETFTGNFVAANADVLSIELGAANGATVSSKIIPANFELAQNYPNPFNPTTTIGFSIPMDSKVTLTIYNITGQKVMETTDRYEAGNHAIEWDASNQASGIYFYKVASDNGFSATKKMVLMK